MEVQPSLILRNWLMSLVTYSTGRTDYRSLLPPFGSTASVRSRRTKAHYRFALRPNTTDAYSFIQVFHQEHYRAHDFARFDEIRREFEAITTAARQPLIIDCGANNGMSAAYFADSWPGAKIVAVEPNRDNAVMLRRNTAELEVDVLEAAITCEPKPLTIVNPDADTNAFRTAGAATGEIEGITVAKLLTRYPAEQFQPFLIKIDIEGFEQDLFAANTEWIDEFPVVIVELHDWMLPGEANSGNFLRAIAARNRDFVYRGDSVFSIRNRNGASKAAKATAKSAKRRRTDAIPATSLPVLGNDWV